MHRFQRFRHHWFLAGLTALTALVVTAVPAAEKTASEAPAATVAIGIQPIGYPSGVISSVMARDRILRAALAEHQTRLDPQPFPRGADIVPQLNAHRLQAGLLGDMPTLLAVTSGQSAIVGLVKQASTSIVTRGGTQVKGLAGKRIGYVEASSAHHTLLQGLEAAGLTPEQIKLVPMRVDEMPAALERGDIDAFAGWEPAPSLALSRNPTNRVVFRGQSTDYFVIDKAFAKDSPAQALQLTASFVRSLEWMRRSRANLEKAAQWVREDGERFSGKTATVTIEQVVAITRREILDVPSAPAIPGSASNPPLRSEFDFLQRLGKLPENARWNTVAEAFRHDTLAQVIGDAKRYRIHSFDYDE